MYLESAYWENVIIPTDFQTTEPQMFLDLVYNVLQIQWNKMHLIKYNAMKYNTMKYKAKQWNKMQ